MTAFDAAIIDLDGTLGDTLGDFIVALDRTLDDLGLRAVPSEFIGRTVGKGSEHLIRRTLAEAGGDAALYEQAWALYQRHCEAFNGEHSTVYAGVREGLERLRGEGLRLACVTHKPLAFARPLLEACKALASAPSRTLVIGDSANDAPAARAAGCRVVLVRYGYNQGEPIERDADGFIDRLDGLDLASWADRAARH